MKGGASHSIRIRITNTNDSFTIISMVTIPPPPPPTLIYSQTKTYSDIIISHFIHYNANKIQTRFQKVGTLQIVNKKGMQYFTNLINLHFIHNRI